jgi:hypothetical protein
MTNVADYSIGNGSHANKEGDKPGLRIFESFAELRVRPFVVLETVLRLLGPLVGNHALAGVQETCINRRVWKHEEEDDSPEKSDQTEDDEKPLLMTCQ